MTNKLRWAPRSYGDGQRIYRGLSFFDKGNLPVPLADVGPTIEEYEDTTAVEGTEYFYRISAYAGTPEVEVVSELVGGISVPGGAAVQAVGFSAQKTPSGTAGASNTFISNYDVEDWDPNSEFDAVAGAWTPATGGIYWFSCAGFPAAGMTGGSEFSVDLYEAGATLPSAKGRDYDTSQHGDSCNFALPLLVTTGAAYKLYQKNDIAEDVLFSAFRVSSDVVFSGSKDDVVGRFAETTDVTGYTEELDTASCFNPTTGVFTAPFSGYYLISFFGFPSSGAISGYSAKLYIDGVLELSVENNESGGTFATSLGHTLLLELTAGQQLKYVQAGFRLELLRFSGTKVSPDVAFSARKATATGASGDTISGWAEDFDLGSCFDAVTGIFTAPSAGKYHLLAHGHDSSLNANETDLVLKKNGVDLPSKFRWGRHYNSTSTHKSSHGFAHIFDLAAGDTLHLVQLNMTAANCYFAVHKIGE